MKRLAFHKSQGFTPKAKTDKALAKQSSGSCDQGRYDSLNLELDKIAYICGASFATGIGKSTLPAGLELAAKQKECSQYRINPA